MIPEKVDTSKFVFAIKLQFSQFRPNLPQFPSRPKLILPTRTFFCGRYFNIYELISFSYFVQIAIQGMNMSHRMVVYLSGIIRSKAWFILLTAQHGRGKALTLKIQVT